MSSTKPVSPTMKASFPQNDFLSDDAPGVEKFWTIAYGYISSSLLFSALEFDLFTLLSGTPGLSREEIARRIGAQDQPLRVLLVGLVSIGLLRHADGRYSCAPLAEKFLSKDGPDNVVPILEWHYHIVYKGMFHLAASVRTGKNEGLVEIPGEGETLYERLAHHPRLERIFHDAMSCISGRTRGEFVSRLPWGTVKHVVDLGGGDGTNARALTGSHPHLKATIFDLPSICDLARKKTAGTPVADRVDAVPGNFITDPLPPADCYLLAHICPIYSEKTIRGIFKKAYNALPPGGKIVVYTMMGDDDHAQPFSAAVGSSYFLAVATGEGMIYPSTDYVAWLKDAGYSKIDRFNFLHDQVSLVAEK